MSLQEQPICDIFYNGTRLFSKNTTPGKNYSDQFGRKKLSYKFSKSNLKIRFTFFLNSLQHLLQVVNKLNMEKGGLSSE